MHLRAYSIVLILYFPLDVSTRINRVEAEVVADPLKTSCLTSLYAINVSLPCSAICLTSFCLCNKGGNGGGRDKTSYRRFVSITFAHVVAV